VSQFDSPLTHDQHAQLEELRSINGPVRSKTSIVDASDPKAVAELQERLWESCGKTLTSPDMEYPGQES